MNECIHLTTKHEASDVRIYKKEVNYLRRQYNVDILSIYDITRNSDRFRTILLLFKSLINVSLKRYRVIHFHDPDILIYILFIKVLSPNSLFIYDVHEDYRKRLNSKKYYGIILKYIYAFVELMTKPLISYYVVATSNISKYYPECKTVIVRNYPIVDNFKKPSEPLIANSKKVSIELFYAGGISSLRGLDITLKLLGEINSVIPANLKLAGKFIHSEKLSDYTSNENWKYVDFLGWLDHDDVLLEMEKADFGVLFFENIEYYMESLPVKMFEYIAAGLPIITSKNYNFSEIIRLYQTGICLDDNYDANKDIVQIFKDPTYDELVYNCKNAIHNFSWEKEFKNLSQIYNKII